MKGRKSHRRPKHFRSVFREMLLFVLYQWEFRKEYEELEQIMDSFIKNRRHRFIRALKERARELVEVMDEIDLIIKENTQYPFDKIELIDKLILRIAVFEMLYKGIPPEISISEAVKLSNKFSSPNAYRFINGVLGEVCRNVLEKAP